ncbi:MAG: ferredoxin reductase [Solirubrobacteraceae bacterium]|nr:ferredoxin reductase [Solirubrobacteraceae bacterium]
MSMMHVLDAAAALTTPLLPDDYLTYLNPLWSRREPRARIEAVMPETRDSATIWLRPGPGFPRHTPGQYVRVGVDVDGVRHWRTYSLTSVPGRRDKRIAITVKAIPDGMVSTHLVHRARRGMIVRLAPPAGEFVLPTTLDRPLLFVTAGSGITPVLGMLRALAARGPLPEIAHVHLAPSRDEVIAGGDLRRLSARHASYRLHEHHDDRRGLFDPVALDVLVPDWRRRPAWGCGPAPLLDALGARYADEGIADHLTIERFRPVIAAEGATGAGGRVRFRASDREIDADGATPLLVAGEEAGVLMPHGCRMGICHTCVGRLCAGSVRDLRTGEQTDGDPDDPPLVRTCISAAAGPVDLDL